MMLWVYDVGIIDWWIGWTPIEKAEFYEDDGIENSFREHAEAVLSWPKTPLDGKATCGKGRILAVCRMTIFTSL